jgi:hypothetical protein
MLGRCTYDIDVGDKSSVRLSDAGPGLTVTPDGKTVVIDGVAVVTQDLMRIENFR